MKIDPSTISTSLDFHDNPDQNQDQGAGTQSGDNNQKPMVPHGGEDIESARNLRSRKASKKKKKEKKKAMKIAERKARQSEEEEDEDESQE